MLLCFPQRRQDMFSRGAPRKGGAILGPVHERHVLRVGNAVEVQVINAGARQHIYTPS